MLQPFQTLFAVPLDCSSCEDAVRNTLSAVKGIKTIEVDLKAELVSITGTAPPSQIVSALQASGKDAILRGTGAPNSAAVCILETFAPNIADPIRGLARMVQVAPNYTIIDLTLRGLRQGKYEASIRTSGDISEGSKTTGSVFGELGRLGEVEVGKDGKGGLFVEREVSVLDLVGRSMVVKSKEDGEEEVLGVIARSAGVWENDKTVCSCSGKSLWEERKENVEKGMV
ncbi:Cu,Zn superoxide dismutase-like protein [Ascobolus immersus RN42]|uniref:Superoxide dismutase 1 copper chaperone n=1 Tax=Ascobolus immersus RN42 TaxID=1160509 RepID=A0A3N4HQ77_ASCIM|nr:Cu,Zn superoxide dismutase-like protein [Ascobolus immersus RN42]